jgi:hypothetical protein
MAQYNKLNDNKLNDNKQKVDEVIVIMKDNVDKILQRDEKLSDIEYKTEELQDRASRFKKVSTKLKHKMWCKNIKFMVLLLIILLVFILIIVLVTIKK